MLENSQKQLEHRSDIFSYLGNECCQNWFDDPSEGLVDMLIYPVVGITVDQLRMLIKLDWPKNQGGWKGMLVAADIQKMDLQDFTSHVQVNAEGPRISIPTEIIRDLKFNGPALIVASPVIDSSHNSPFSVVIPLLRLHRGNAMAWGKPINLRYNRKTQKHWIAHSIGKPYSSNTDGPFDSLIMRQNISETISALVCADNSNQDRAIFALELFNQANESINASLRVSIFNYWSAIETLCDSNNESILLQHLFEGESDKTAPGNRKLFGEVRILRHNVIHKGHAPFSNPYILERYLQVVFLDMLRDILKLPYAGYIEQFTTLHGTCWFQEKYKKKK